MNSVSHKKQVPAFLEKLFEILDENSSYVTLISWQPDGKSFLIKRVNEFSETVLPKYFKHSNIQSCVRQLNMYGFSKTRHGSNFREYSHKMFLRGRRDLLVLIKRKAMTTSPKGGNVPSSFHPNDELPIDYIKQENEYGYDGYNDEDDEMQGSDRDDHYHDDQNNYTAAGEGDIHQHNTTSDSSYDGYVTSSSSTVVQLLHRVDTLEDHIRAITAQYTTLLAKHNQLCDTLMLKQQAADDALTSIATVVSDGTCDHQQQLSDCKVIPPVVRRSHHQQQQQSHSSSSSSSSTSGGSPTEDQCVDLTTSEAAVSTTASVADNFSGAVLCVDAGTRISQPNGNAINSGSGALIPQPKQSQQPQLLPQVTFYDFNSLPSRAAFPLPSSSSSSSCGSASAFAHQSLLVPYQHQLYRSPFSSMHAQESVDEINSGGGGGAKKRRYSIDIGGLEAISLAATMLDHRVSNHNSCSSSSSGGTALPSSSSSAAVMTVSDPRSGEVTAAVMDCDYLLSMCNGGSDTTLRKAYSIG